MGASGAAEREQREGSQTPARVHSIRSVAEIRRAAVMKDTGQVRRNHANVMDSGQILANLDAMSWHMPHDRICNVFVAVWIYSQAEAKFDLCHYNSFQLRWSDWGL